MNDLVTERELQFAIRLGVAVLCGMLIGLERESRKKPAGVSTHCFVIAVASSLFAVVVPRIPHLSTWGKDNDP